MGSSSSSIAFDLQTPRPHAPTSQSTHLFNALRAHPRLGSRGLSRLAMVALMAVLAVAWSSAARAYTPDDPQVLAMVDKGIAYLEKADFKGVTGEYAGGNILVGYTVYKVTGDKDHPLVKRGWKMPSSVPAIPRRARKAFRRSCTTPLSLRFSYAIWMQLCTDRS